MAIEKKEDYPILQMQDEILEKLAELDKAINARFERMKKTIMDYLNLGNEMARASVIAALKNI